MTEAGDWTANTNESGEIDVEAHGLPDNTNESAEADEVEAHGLVPNTNEISLEDD